MILSHRGYDVTVFEKEADPGGRNRAFHLGPYTFNFGPTFFMLPNVLKEIFYLSGKQFEDYLDLIRIEPMYNLAFENMAIQHYNDQHKMQQEIENKFPGNENAVTDFLNKEKIRFERMYPCLKKAYPSIFSMVSLPLIRALPQLSIFKSLFQVLDHYFNGEQLIVSFTFQSKYLGMSPWKCPGAFGIIPYIEHKYGIDYLRGGLGTISVAMSKVAAENGAKIRLLTPVHKVVVKNGTAQGVELNNGEFFPSDAVVLNADFGFAMKTLFAPGVIKKWKPENLLKKTYSCSTFMLYLGLDTQYKEHHHTILFADNYRSEMNSIEKNEKLNEDFSVYLNNASIIDPTLAPPGHSALYILVPVANLKSSMQWTKEECMAFRNKIINRIKLRTSMNDIDQHIKAEFIISPRDWEHNHNLFIGATFNLGHTLNQMLYFRPHNRFEEVNRLYLCGGGTHPGSGLPTIFESGRISSDLISKDLPLKK